MTLETIAPMSDDPSSDASTGDLTKQRTLLRNTAPIPSPGARPLLIDSSVARCRGTPEEQAIDMEGFFIHFPKGSWADVHSVEPIPEADRDSTGPQQMWIWAGANITPVNWALGALGITLKLGLWETIAVIVVGNLIGCAIFAAFTVMGHKTGVNQMVLCRSAFGRRGAYLPSALMFLMTLGWIGVNTYFPVKISMAILSQFGIPESFAATLVIITVVMVVQVF